MDRLKKFKARIGPWITKIGMTIYLVIPGGSVVLLILFFIFPDLFKKDVLALWEKMKKIFKKKNL